MRLGNSSNTTLLVRLKAQKSQVVFWGRAAEHIQVSSVFLFCFFKIVSPKNILIYTCGAQFYFHCGIFDIDSERLGGAVMECRLY